ncbi:homocitrate synthase NifV [Sporobacter termitidis DSM 10068]|uniref:Homocitrate synthase NifV n=1 Tax=Sporobacter termitidis DSM 10068 TaxID=1123282 RepID=A0A1M5XIZ4_9FIRM|nr:homocitrate synthase [Sporobacter termitidis]SHH99807.1 homocitrate synthase NifV [Sporobacter termitidis DSM 10068]
MKPIKYIVDTTMRDGEQTPGIAMSTEQKLRIAQILDSAGVYQIEAGIPAVSAMEMDTIRAMTARRRHSKISVWNRLVLDDVKKSVDCAPDIIHISTPVSYVLIYSKLNKNKTWVSKNLEVCVDYAQSRGFEVTVGFEDASRADITFMAGLARQLKDMGVGRIRYADTVGVLSPSRTFGAVREIIDYAGIEVELHAHNDLGMAVANTILGAKAGANYLDTTVLGLGERVGNCDFLKLIQAAHDLFDLGITRYDAGRAQSDIAEILSLS